MLILLPVFGFCVDPPAPFAPTPRPEQLSFHREELSAFIHFGMNTFTGREWGTGTEDEQTFNPTGLDTDQWVETLQKANFKRILLTSKHHDGFCNFNTKYTKHQVNASKKWVETAKKLGKSIDIFEEFSKSATKYNMNVGLYLSLWDMNSPYYGQGEPYNEYYMSQLTEILGNKKYGNNGKFVEVWMDGAHDPSAKYQEYAFDRYFNHIWDLQPGCIIYSIYGSTARWSGTEAGGVGDPSWSRINQTYVRQYYDEHWGSNPQYLWNGDEKGDWYCPAECDVSITGGWFWTTGRKPKSIEDIANIYFNTVGHGEVLLLNVPPTTDGVFGKEFVDRVVEFGECVNKTFMLNLATLPIVTVSASGYRGNDKAYKPENVIDQDAETYWTLNDDQTTGWLEIDFNVPQVFDVISISEYIALGQRVKKFTVEVFLFSSQQWMKIGDFNTIGHKRLIRTYPNTASKIRFNITESLAVPLISGVGAFKAYGGFALSSGVPVNLTETDFSQLTKSAGWKTEGDVIVSSTAGSTAEFAMDGTTKSYIVGTTSDDYGQFDVYIDDKFIKTVDAKSKGTIQRVKLFDGPDLDLGKHNMKVVVKSGKVAIHAFYWLKNNGAGMFEIVGDTSVKRGSTLNLKVQRVGGSKGAASVTFLTAPGTAVHGEDYEDVQVVLNFNDGETEKSASVKTIDNGKTGEFNFFTQLNNPSGGAYLGWNDNVQITIKNKNSLSAIRVGSKTFAGLAAGALIVAAVALVVGAVIMRRRAAAAVIEEHPLYTE